MIKRLKLLIQIVMVYMILKWIAGYYIYGDNAIHHLYLGNIYVEHTDIDESLYTLIPSHANIQYIYYTGEFTGYISVVDPSNGNRRTHAFGVCM